jgi:hypothetical protein
MTDPVSALSLGSMAFTAAGKGVSAFGQSSADKYEAEEHQLASQEGTVKATQLNAGLTRNLNQTLGNIDAIRAASHTDPTSPTGAAVRGQIEATSTENKNIQVDSIMEQARQDADAAAYLRSASSDALLAGGIGVGAGILGKEGIAGLPSLTGGVGAPRNILPFG